MRVETAYAAYHADMVRDMSRFCRDEQAARDGVSHAFTQAVARRTDLEAMPDPAQRAWLYAAARNAVIDLKRRERRLLRLSLEAGDDPSQALADRVTVSGLLDWLPPGLRDPVRMKYFEAMNATEIGRVMDLPPATVRTRLRRAMTLMRAILESDEEE